ncbi:hypothetical protein ACH5RR_003106 [Cinchona calisaya]|uniref:CBM-cenC domain-containing protein n=1 Tax=Cinchona calisaya TaxID=153742 RepID=A0ABD3ATW5_9GENT
MSKNSDINIIHNHDFSKGLHPWHPNCCQAYVESFDSSSYSRGKSTKFGSRYAVVKNRKKDWQGLEQDITSRVSTGIQQEITGKVKRKLAYEFEAVVRIYGNNVHSADVEATLGVQNSDNRMEYLSIAKVTATNKDWVQMKGMFLVNGSPSRVVIYLEGPPPGIDILLDSLVNPGFGVNIIANSNLNDGIQGWDPVGNCTLSVGTGSPCNLASIAIESHHHQPLSGRYILAQRRTEKWMGPSQKIKHKVKLHLTYQVSAHVRIGHGATSPQSVKVTFEMDNKWVDGGEVEIRDNKWHETAGSFRIEEQPSELMVSIHGPDKDMDLMVAGLQIFPVDRQVRFDFLKRQTDQVESPVQQWLRDLDKKDLKKAVEKLLKDLLEQYKGKFKHHDVNNEMMHRSFYRDKLGKDATQTCS